MFTIPKCQLAVIKIDYSVLAIFYVDGDIQLVITLCPDNCWQMPVTYATQTINKCLTNDNIKTTHLRTASNCKYRYLLPDLGWLSALWTLLRASALQCAMSTDPVTWCYYDGCYSKKCHLSLGLGLRLGWWIFNHCLPVFRIASFETVSFGILTWNRLTDLL